MYAHMTFLHELDELFRQPAPAATWKHNKLMPHLQRLSEDVLDQLSQMTNADDGFPAAMATLIQLSQAIARIRKLARDERTERPWQAKEHQPVLQRIMVHARKALEHKTPAARKQHLRGVVGMAANLPWLPFDRLEQEVTAANAEAIRGAQKEAQRARMNIWLFSGVGVLAVLLIGVMYFSLAFLPDWGYGLPVVGGLLPTYTPTPEMTATIPNPTEQPTMTATPEVVEEVIPTVTLPSVYSSLSFSLISPAFPAPDRLLFVIDETQAQASLPPSATAAGGVGGLHLVWQEVPATAPVTLVYRMDQPLSEEGLYQFWMIDALEGAGNAVITINVSAGGQPVQAVRGGTYTQMTKAEQKSGADEWVCLGIYQLPAGQPIEVTLTGTTGTGTAFLGLDALAISRLYNERLTGSPAYTQHFSNSVVVAQMENERAALEPAEGWVLENGDGLWNTGTRFTFTTPTEKPAGTYTLDAPLWVGRYEVWAWMGQGTNVDTKFTLTGAAGVSVEQTVNGPVNPSNTATQATLISLGFVTVEKDLLHPELTVKVEGDGLPGGVLVIDDLFLTVAP